MRRFPYQVCPNPELPPPTSLLVDRPLQGIFLVCLGTVLLAGSDAAAKYLNEIMSPIAIAWTRYAVYAAIMAVVVQRKGISSLRTQRPVLQLARGLFALASAVCFITSVKYLPLAEATAVTFIAPMFVTLLAVAILSEVVGWHRWAALVVGFVGVLIIVRPGYGTFEPAFLWPIGAALFWAAVTVITRMIAGVETAITTVAWSAVAGFLAVTALWLWTGPTLPGPAAIAIGAIVGVLATAGQWLVVISSRYAEASALAPFTYTQLFWSCVLGYYVFNAIPDGWAIVGMIPIILSGLYMTYRERLRTKRH